MLCRFFLDASRLIHWWQLPSQTLSRLASTNRTRKNIASADQAGTGRLFGGVPRGSAQKGCTTIFAIPLHSTGHGNKHDLPKGSPNLERAVATGKTDVQQIKLLVVEFLGKYCDIRHTSGTPYFRTFLRHRTGPDKAHAVPKGSPSPHPAIAPGNQSFSQSSRPRSTFLGRRAKVRHRTHTQTFLPFGAISALHLAKRIPS